MEGNLSGRPAQGHVHSNFARMIVNDLAIARYEATSIKTEESKCCVLDKDNNFKINDSTRTYKLETSDNSEVFRESTDYSSEAKQIIGKHYRVSHCSNPKLYRHYTICNVM